MIEPPTPAAGAAPPLFRVVRGRPDDAELAAVAVALLAALARRRPPGAPLVAPPSPWSTDRYRPPTAWNNPRHTPSAPPRTHWSPS